MPEWEHLISDVMSQVHDSPTGGHMGVAKTLEKLRQQFYWVKQRSTVKEWYKKCDLCNSRKSPPRKRCAPLQPIQIDGPLKCVAMDILGPLPIAARGNKYVLVVGDYFTKINGRRLIQCQIQRLQQLQDSWSMSSYAVLVSLSSCIQTRSAILNLL